jgi:hypothetical protein
LALGGLVFLVGTTVRHVVKVLVTFILLRNFLADETVAITYESLNPASMSALISRIPL